MQLAGALGGRTADAQLKDVDVRASQSYSNVTDYSMRSVDSSINSQSGLLSGKSKHIPSHSQYGTSSMDGDMHMPKRKTRRIRDPYAIDLSDEEDEDEMPSAAAARSRREPPHEETLAEFLRNYTPPLPEPTVQPFAINQPEEKLKRKGSALSRLARRNSSYGNHQVGGGSQSSRAPTGPAAGAQSRRGYIPIQVNIPPGVDMHSPSHGSSIGSMVAGSGASRSGLVGTKKFEPRDAVQASSRVTSDLVEFFKNSEPPRDMGPPALFQSPVAQQDETGGFPKVFTRRKKTSIA
jgi:hypothetical protein